MVPYNDIRVVLKVHVEITEDKISEKGEAFEYYETGLPYIRGVIIIIIQLIHKLLKINIFIDITCKFYYAVCISGLLRGLKFN